MTSWANRHAGAQSRMDVAHQAPGNRTKASIGQRTHGKKQDGKQGQATGRLLLPYADR